MRDPSIVGTLELRARQSAADICSKPWYIGLSPDGLLGSTVLFTRPHRTFMPNSTVIRTSSLGISFIPTKYLSGIFELSQMALSNEKSLYLYDKLTFPFPFSTRSTIGHGHEILMHRRLCSAGAGPPISIFSKENVEVQMLPSSHLLPGTAAALKSAGISNSFYWTSSTLDFPGIDGILGDTSGNLFVVQAMTVDDHISPVVGLRRVWDKLRGYARQSRLWHFVVVADDRQVLDSLVAEFSEELDGFTFGRSCVSVQVWGCVLRG